MIRRLFCISALAFAVFATSVPAAHAATISPSKWAPKFCTAVIDYQTTISEKSDALSSALDNVTDLAAARDQIAGFLGEMVTAANTAKRAVQAAGVPSSPNGAKIQALFVAGLGASAKVFAKGKATAAKLPTTSVTEFQTKGKELGVGLADAGEKLSKSFSGVPKLDKGKKLETAVKAEPECAPIV